MSGSYSTHGRYEKSTQEMMVGKPEGKRSLGRRRQA